MDFPRAHILHTPAWLSTVIPDFEGSGLPGGRASRLSEAPEEAESSALGAMGSRDRKSDRLVTGRRVPPALSWLVLADVDPSPFGGDPSMCRESDQD